MKSIKRIATLFFAMMALCVGLSAQVINAKNGYKNLKWGSSVAEAQKAGFKLAEIPENDEVYELFVKGQAQLYKVTNNKDKDVGLIIFAYHNGNLFGVTEELKNPPSWNSSKIQKRYGKLLNAENGLYIDNMNFSALHVFVGVANEGALAQLYDEGTFVEYTVTGRNISGNGATIVDSLAEIAEKLVQPGKGGKKPSYAFLNLTTDNRNALVESYVTDALTEAVFTTGAIRIVERSKLEKVLSEQKFQSGGLVNEASAKEIGNLIGADYVCYGTVKDLQNQITINARVVDVSTGELCAMGRATVKKDSYLANVGYEAVAGTSANAGGMKSSSSNASAKNPAAKVENNLWVLQKFRNDFDGYTQYTFWQKNMDYYYIVVALTKYDNAVKSRAFAGTHWPYSGLEKYLTSAAEYPDIEYKEDSGNIVTQRCNFDGRREIYYTKKDFIKVCGVKNDNGKAIMELFLNNRFITLRCKNTVVRFQTEGLEEKMNEAGLSLQDFYDAYANEEF